MVGVPGARKPVVLGKHPCRKVRRAARRKADQHLQRHAGLRQGTRQHRGAGEQAKDLAALHQFFSTFTPAIVDEVSAVARPSVPLAIDAPTIRWDGRKLGMKFNLRFTGKEGENQQGHIVVLARGPDTLLAYPSGVIGGIDSRALLDPAQGEFFSVSRFRETRVEFPAVASKIVSLEVLLFGTDRLDGKRKLLVREVLKVPPREGDRP